MTNKFSVLAAAAMVGALTLAGHVHAQTAPTSPQGGMGGMSMPSGSGGGSMGGMNMPAGGASNMPYAKDLAAVSEKMDAAGAAIKFTGDADRDFAMLMIPHHEGALDMAQVMLRYGKDPGLRATAENILKEQVAEIEKLKVFLAKK